MLTSRQSRAGFAAGALALLVTACQDASLPLGNSPNPVGVGRDVVPEVIDGRIAFTHGAYGLASDIAIINPDGTGFVNLTNSPEPEMMGGWAPDGSRIIFERGVAPPGDYGVVYPTRFDIWTMDADGTDQQLVVGGPGVRLAPVYSPDGTQIAYTQGPNLNLPQADIYVANADGTGVTNITNSPFVDGCPRWSPDGSRILFSSNRDGPGPGPLLDFNLFLMNPDGTGVVQLTSEAGVELCPGWSPDGQWIAYGHSGNETPGLYVMAADGTGKTRIYVGRHASQPSWSPQGDWLVFQQIKGGAGYPQIFRVRTDGSGLFRLTNSTSPYGMNLNPIWSP